MKEIHKISRDWKDLTREQEAINDCIEAIRELQELMDNRAGKESSVTSASVRKEPTYLNMHVDQVYTIKELREKFNEYKCSRFEKQGAQNAYFLDWLEEDSKKGR